MLPKASNRISDSSTILLSLISLATLCYRIDIFHWRKNHSQICGSFYWAASWQNQQNGMCTQRRLRSAWSESSLSAWRKLGSLAIHWVHREDSDQTGRYGSISTSQQQLWEECMESLGIFINVKSLWSNHTKNSLRKRLGANGCQLYWNPSCETFSGLYIQNQVG